MSIPTPPIDLVNHCTAVWNNTLYVYSPQGFQSLPLDQGAKWQTLDAGTSVTGGLCVPSLTTGNEALWIVGGTPNATATTDYSGLQRFHFEAQTWETVTPSTPITQDRTGHGAAFINATNSILVYSGSQTGDTGLSTQTFVLSAAPPFDVLSFNSQGAPALTSPMLMPWNEDHLVMIGGSADNTQVWIFGQTEGWVNLGTTLPAGLGLDSPTKQCTIVTGDDGSKVLEIYDLGASPNIVTRYALLVNNAPALAGQQVGAPSAAPTASSSRRRRRDLTLSDWPAYNSTLAPTTTRSGASLAQDPNGLAVISGGDSGDPIAMFDQTGNSWINATSLLVKEQIPLQTSTTSSLPALSTVQPTSTTTSAPAASSTASDVLGTGQSKSKVLTTLGATLGAIFGLAAILIIILLLLRWRKQKMKGTKGRMNEKEDRMSFADQGADFMQEAGGARGRAYSASANSSLTSLQIFQTKGAKSHRRGSPSDGSQAPLAKNKSPLGVSDPMEMAQMSQRSSPTFTNRSIDPEKEMYPAPKPAELTPAAAAAVASKGGKDERSRSNGWSRYFTNNDVTNLASMQGGRNTYNTDISEMSRSEYDDGRRSNGSSVRPLELNMGPKFEGQRLSAVATGSPTMGRSHEDIQQGLSAEIRRTSSSSRDSDPGFEFSPDHGRTPATSTWTPAGSRDGVSDRKADTRSISSAYSATNPFFGGSSEMDPRPRKGSAPALPKMNLGNYGDASRDSQGSAVTVLPSGLDSPRAHAFPSKVQSNMQQTQASDDYGFPMPRAYFGDDHRDSSGSNVTVFPGAPATTPSSNFGISGSSGALRNGPSGRKNTAGEDLGWLNLNDGRTPS